MNALAPNATLKPVVSPPLIAPRSRGAHAQGYAVGPADYGAAHSDRPVRINRYVDQNAAFTYSHLANATTAGSAGQHIDEFV